MKRVAVFGNAGGGKSTLSRLLAETTGLPLHPVDLMQFAPGGAELGHEHYIATHERILAQDRWIIDGFGTVESAWKRFDAADTLIYIDLPLTTHYWWATKRLWQGMYRTPAGWPEVSWMVVLIGTLKSYRVIGECERRLAPRYRKLVREASASKRVHHLQSPKAIRTFRNQMNAV